MMAPTRLFDLLSYQLEKYPKEDMLAAKEPEGWKKYSAQEVRDITRRLSSGLLQSGISANTFTPESQDKIAIISNNRPEWIFTDLACQQIGAVLVPIYPTFSEPELKYVLNDAAVKMVLVSDEALYKKVSAIKDKIPSIREIYTFNAVEGAKHWTALLQMYRQQDETRIDALRDAIGPRHLTTIIYTSGTTGNPKGVMLSHSNILSNVLSCMAYLPVDNTGRALSFLPLNHIYERMITYVFVMAGVSIYYAESMDTIAANLREVQPSIFTTVPRLLEKVYEKIMAKGMELKGIKKSLFFWAVDLGKRFELNKDQGWWYNTQLRLANRLIFNKWREALGGEVKAIVTGSAACQVRLLKIFTAARVAILEGYGLTETSPVISVNRIPLADRMFGTVGPVIKGVSVKIAEDGEILCKGPNVMMGYYKRPDLTADTMQDGWFHTGDIGMLVDNKFLKITDRKKELFKTSGGKYVAPQPIENKMKESPYIEQIMVLGADQKFVAALIVPAFAKLKDWCVKQGITYTSSKAIIREPRVVKLYHDTVEKYNPLFNHVEQVKKFELLPDEWTIDGGELTPTLKLKRKVVMEKYRGIIESIYSPAS